MHCERNSTSEHETTNYVHTFDAYFSKQPQIDEVIFS